MTAQALRRTAFGGFVVLFLSGASATTSAFGSRGYTESIDASTHGPGGGVTINIDVRSDCFGDHLWAYEVESAADGFDEYREDPYGYDGSVSESFFDRGPLTFTKNQILYQLSAWGYDCNWNDYLEGQGAFSDPEPPRPDHYEDDGWWGPTIGCDSNDWTGCFKMRAYTMYSQWNDYLDGAWVSEVVPNIGTTCSQASPNYVSPSPTNQYGNFMDLIGQCVPEDDEKSITDCYDDYSQTVTVTASNQTVQMWSGRILRIRGNGTPPEIFGG